MARRPQLRPVCRLALLAMLASSGAALAGSEESTAETLILPLAIEGFERTSVVTLSNGTDTPVTVKSSWFGAIGSPLAVDRVGEIACEDAQVAPLGALTIPLAVLCPRLRTPDIENRGYLRLRVQSDLRAFIGASIMTTADQESRFRVDAEPLGAHDIAAPIVRFMQDDPRDPFRNLDPLEVAGVEGEVVLAGGNRDLVARCWVAAPDGGKPVDLVLRDAKGGPMGSPISIVLKDHEMEVVDVFDRAGLPPGTYDQIRVLISTPVTGSPGLGFAREPIVAGCGSERLSARQIDYRRARTRAPSDATRQARIDADSSLTSGPFMNGTVLQNTLWGDPASTKAVVAVFVQPEDRINCRALVRNPRFIGLPTWPELQVRDAAGRVVAGGDGVTETGLFDTGPRDRPGGALAGPWTIEVSLDEATFSAIDPPPDTSRAGVWGVMCESGAGLSQPILQAADGFNFPTDDF